MKYNNNNKGACLPRIPVLPMGGRKNSVLPDFGLEGVSIHYFGVAREGLLLLPLIAGAG